MRMAKIKKVTQAMLLRTGQKWIKKYTGKRIVHGYAKHFNVDLLRAITELRMLGVVISDDYEKAVKLTFEQRATKRKQKAAQQSPAQPIESDFYFAYIGGYTNAGAAYGITWEELNKTKDEENTHDDSLPF
jgi:hypothetical protein